MTSNSSWLAALEKIRFDIIRREPLQAHKEYDANSSADIFVTSDGAVRLVLTRRVGDTKQEKKISRHNREYTIFREQNVITIVNCRINPDEDLGDIVGEIETTIGM